MIIKMIQLLLLAVSVISTIGQGTEPCPTCFLINRACYNSTHLFDLEAPFRNDVVIHKIGVLRSKNLLFFSFEPIIDDPEYYKTGFVNLDNPQETGVIMNNINQILNFGSFDFDQDNNLIYFGGSDGIFILDMNNNKVSSFSSRGDMITNVVYKNNIYFTRYDHSGIIVKIGDNFLTLLEYMHVKKFVVNKMGVLVFVNDTGLYVSKAHTNIAKRLSQNAFFRGITIDLDDNVYAWWIDGLYKINVEKDLNKSTIVKVADLEGIGAMVFDNENNILFTHERGLFKVTPSLYGCGLVN